MNTIKKESSQGLGALWKIAFVALLALLASMIVAPWVFKVTQKITLFGLDGQPFRRVFDRVILVALVLGIIIAWRWINLKFNFKQLYRRKRALSNFSIWLIIGWTCISILIFAQVMVELRYGRDRSFSYMVKKTIAAIFSAMAVAALEESIFRGYMLQAFLQKVSKYKAIFMTSAIFALIHVFSLDFFLKPIKESAKLLDGTQLMSGFELVGMFFVPLKTPLAIIPGLVGLFLAAWLLAELTIRTKSLWAAIGLHAGWVFAIKFWGRLWKYSSDPPVDAGSSFFYGEKYAATGVLGWIMVGFLILIVTGVISYLIYRMIAAGASIIPHKTAVKLGKQLGKIMYLFALKKRKVALKNVKAAFPEKSEKECIQIVKESFQNLGIVCLEFLQFKKMLATHESFLHVTNEDSFQKTWAEGHGIIFFTGHFGNWEMLALQCASRNYDFAAVGREFRNKLIYRHISKIRTLGGVKTFAKKESARLILKGLKNNMLIGLVADQYAGRGGLFVDFFGRPASTTAAVATIARKTGAAIVPAFNHMLPDGKHETFLHPAIHVNKTADAKKDVFDATQALMKVLENEIRERPGAYLWAHRKWR